MADASIPVYTNLEDLYANLGTSLDHVQRWNHLAEEFEQRFGNKPQYIARAPGRVKYKRHHFDLFIHLINWQPHRSVGRMLIPRLKVFTDRAGEHIDYALFGVCPAAVERDILIACAPREILPSSPVDGSHLPGSVVAENIHPKYDRQTFAPGSRPSKSTEDEDVHAWHLDINTKELRWESYVKAGYYVCTSV